MKRFKLNTINLIYTALGIALGLTLPFIFHAVGLGSNFLPMYLPVLLCGLSFGPISGLLCGLICPFLSSVITGMPPLYPTAFVMTLECSIFGYIGGILYHKYKVNIFLTIIIVLIIGRFAGAIFQLFLIGLNQESFWIYLTTYFMNGLPGLILNIIVVPILVYSLKKAKLTSREF